MKEGNNKNFDKWNNLKKCLHQKNRVEYFDKKEIWWCALGVNIGVEQDGKNNNFERPILVLRKFNNYSLWILPFTSKNKEGKYYFGLEYRNKKYSLILSQMRLVSSHRLLRKIRKVNNYEFNQIRRELKKLV